MIREIGNAVAACVVTFVICVVAYPATVWGLGRFAFPSRAEGSMIYARDLTVIGSELVAQPFASEKYFQPRPSAVDYKADATGGSNLGTKNPDLRKKVAERAEALKATAAHPAPVDLVMASGAGLDPHISPEAAEYQVARVAAARKTTADWVRELVAQHTESSGRFIGAPPRVNVLLLNLAMDQAALAPASEGARDNDVTGAAAAVKKPAKRAEATQDSEPVAPSGLRAVEAVSHARADHAALASGLSSEPWRGETEGVGKKGVDREKASTAAPGAIEAAFAGLTKETGRDWLADYRQLATKK